MPTLEKENILHTKFAKKSLVNIAAKAFHDRDGDQLIKYNICNIKLKELIRLIKKG